MATRPPLSVDASTSRNGMASLEQNRAAGGAEFRRMLTKSGEAVTVSLDVTASEDGTYRARLRFKSGGSTVQRPVGKVSAPNRFQALKLAWSMLKAEKIAEKEGWCWVTPAGPAGTAG